MYSTLDPIELATAVREESGLARGLSNRALCARMRDHQRDRSRALDDNRLYDCDMANARLSACQAEASYRFAVLVADGQDQYEYR